MASRSLMHILRTACALAAVVGMTTISWAGGNNNNFRQNAVGGVSIDAFGVVAGPSVEAARMLRASLEESVTRAEPGMARPTTLRMVSLRGLEAAIADAMENNLGRLPDEVKYLAGMQRIQHVFLYPEANDIVLAGPGEGWKVDGTGNVVGITTGRPVLQLEDLLVAFRTVTQAGEGEGIGCSIDPSTEGQQRLNAYLKSVRQFNPAVVKGVEEAMGPQQIRITGVPTDSHFARVLVAADFRMKRYAMHLEPSPVPEMISFIDLLAKRRTLPKNMTPRWWLATDYEPLLRSEDRLAWEIRGQGVKCMTENDFVDATGERVGIAGSKNPLAQEWADLMNKHYNTLMQRDPVFGELRNVMDMCVVAALIESEGMLATVDLKLPTIYGENDKVSLSKWHTPKSVATYCGFKKVGSSYVITASGGVQVDSWEAAEVSVVNASVSQVRSQASPAGKTEFWWN
ncbi:DUF1598 domain-containing protein [Lignipirellula cremea]|uniref:DUF1598 domain-containing protein n=1 Tax=Lignipirellula cremea TaxID=2528010 RepID=A0A518DPF5_9BACT|nr:DUF1598 domain-containing protein [Lignipirellula cremea]QDU93725.1 hypothetical protein Pla8534_15070 [Lignipirellula cremea]